MSDLKFTIIVPTRERSDTLKHTIKSVLAQDYSNFTVLVSDNASEDDTAAVVASFNDPRVQYVNTGTRVSMSENWEFALSHVNDGWVTIIGDDDGLIPGCLKKVSDIAKSFNTRAVRSNGCFYTWPSLRNSEYGKLGIRFKPGCEIRRTSSMLQNVLDGKKSYTELPMLYNGGFVCYSLIDEIKKITPRFFRSITPDVYSAMVFSLVAENYVYSYEPLALNGASIHSGGTANFEKQKRKRSYDPAKKFHDENTIPFNKMLPLTSNGEPIKLISVLVYEAFLNAEPFHSFSSVKTSHAQQLDLVNRETSQKSSEIRNWIQDFAHLHQLEVPNSQQSFTTLIKLKNWMRKMYDALNIFVIEGSKTIRLENVHSASILAGQLMDDRPTHVLHLKNVLMRVLAKLK